MKVPFVDLRQQQREIDGEVWPQLRRVFDETSFIGGAPVSEFEREYARFVGSDHCVGVGNGTDALELAMRAAGVMEGSQVILPANTFIATAEAVLRIGASPVLVDVDDEHLLMDPNAVADAITEQTTAIVPVHLYGQVAPVERIEPLAREVGAVIIEDAAQSQGATRFGRSAGSLGAVAATSFYPGKNLGAAGDAGAVTTDDSSIAASVRMRGAHGSRIKYDHEVIGFNSRLDTVQAVVLRAKLARLSRWNEMRRTAAHRYAEMLADIPGLRLPGTAEGNSHVWHLYVIRVGDRDSLARHLDEAGIGTGIHYPTPLHRSRALAEMLKGSAGFPVTESAADSMLSLPMFPHITEDQQQYVSDVVREAMASDVGLEVQHASL
jgi:dTDP-4-amino-4,6-dideoxygalactose transaminase